MGAEEVADYSLESLLFCCRGLRSFQRGCYLFFTKGLFLRSFSITRSDAREISPSDVSWGNEACVGVDLELGERVMVYRAKITAASRALTPGEDIA